jgi:hypothetical protein
MMPAQRLLDYMVIENRFAFSIRARRLMAAEWEMGSEG